MLTQAYTSGIDARLSRVSTLGFNSPNGTRYPLAAYRRAGMDLFAVVDYPAVDIQLDRTWSAADRKRRTNGWTSQAAGVYPGLDRFGRVIAQSWLDGVTGSTAAGYRPAIVDQIHTYDLASNRLSKRDGRAGGVVARAGLGARVSRARPTDRGATRRARRRHARRVSPLATPSSASVGRSTSVNTVCPVSSMQAM